MIKSLIATALLSFSVGAKSLPTQEAAITYNDRAYVSGSYNLRDSFDFELDDFDYSEYTIIFEDISSIKSYLCPISFWDGHGSFYYLQSIVFNTNLVNNCSIRFNIYDVFSTNYFELVISEQDELEDLDQDFSDLVVNFRSYYILNGDEAKLFNVFFTHDDNILTTTYNGYYSFNNGLSSFNAPFFIVGAISFNNQTYDLFTNGTDGMGSDLKGYFFDLNMNQYVFNTYGLPFDRNYVVSNNALFSNGKMSKSSYQNMTHFGVFAYQHDSSYDNADFHDLLFSVMDSPIYMISRLLNFELFNINLYIALAGLLTVVVIVFCVRKFL